MDEDAKPHPLEPWLEKQGLRAYEFADQNGLNRGTIYDLVRGRRAKIGTLVSVETATGGEVSLRDMVAWMNPQPKGNAYE